ncbi:MAG: transglutaminase family protein [Ilumatobacter sp.]|nr:transglutaminase family protein [Ilumatobacter sp.]
MPSTVPTRRSVSSTIVLDVGDRADLVLAVAVAEGYECDHEALTIELDGAPVEPALLPTGHGGRLHQLLQVDPGRLTIEYQATVVGAAEPAGSRPVEWWQYIRPSRYCESDQLGPLARDQFAGLDPVELLAGVSSWVGEHIAYVSGSSRPTDGAIATLLGRTGVCRDFAHLTIALLRANGVPARLAAVYAPGLDPMDFHAVVEAYVGESWLVVDPTCLAPRSSMVRIATGADAADTAFLTTVAGTVDLVEMEVSAVAEPDLPIDGVTELVQLR